MSQAIIQTAFHAGEWAPPLNARVDLAKYHSAAALLRNFFVDYRGGASSRAGTKYVLQAYNSGKAVRLIPFQASFTVGYILEFGDFYVRFHSNGAPILENSIAITGATQANPCVVSAVNSFAVGDWVFISGVNGMTQLNGRYFLVTAVTGTTVTLGAIINGAAVDSTTYGAWTSGGTIARVYTLPTPYAAADLALLKFSQNVDSLILVHPNYQPAVLKLISSTNWTLQTITFGTTVATPTSLGFTTTLAAGTVNYAYTVTAVDANGQESAAAAPLAVPNLTDIRTVAGSIRLTWTAVSGAKSYNIYRAEPSYGNAVPIGAAYGFVGNATGTTFVDSNINPDFSQGPPIDQNPFLGSGIDSFNITNPGAYTTVPGVTIAAPPSGATATAAVVLGVISATINAAGTGYSVGDILSMSASVGSIACTLKVTSVGGGGAVTGFSIQWPGAVTGLGTAVQPNPIGAVSGSSGTGFSINATWGVVSINLIDAGTGYLSAPAVTFSVGAAAATAVLAPAGGNPSAITFYQQRLVLAAPLNAVQTVYMSQPGAYYNFDISNPIQADDAITASIVAGQLNEIKSMLSVPTGLLTFTSKATWLISGGQGIGTIITPASIQANAHSYVGASDVPPIVSNYDILFVQDKGSIVRDLSYNFYAQIFTGTDISVLSSHLFYGFTINEWAWGEEPFKVVWCVRNDGTMLTLTFLKEQELIGWAHSDTNGLFKSVATVTETTQSAGAVDAIYTVVQRTVGGTPVQYIERFAERQFNGQAKNAWCVDAGKQYSGAPATSFSGMEHLQGMTVTGLADGTVIPPFTMPVNGEFTLASPASVVTVGLAFTPQLKTLPLDLGEPTVQGKRKKITAVSVRCSETLGLSIGKSFSSLVAMKELVVGNLNGMTNSIVTDLVTADARTIIDPSWDVPGQYCIQQSSPLPATILGVIPEISVGDTPEGGRR